jgi:hypothetical protein
MHLFNHETSVVGTLHSDGFLTHHHGVTLGQHHGEQEQPQFRWEIVAKNRCGNAIRGFDFRRQVPSHFAGATFDEKKL